MPVCMYIIQHGETCATVRVAVHMPSAKVTSFPKAPGAQISCQGSIKGEIMAIIVECTFLIYSPSGRTKCQHSVTISGIQTPLLQVKSHYEEEMVVLSRN
ncbi:hypothetical protein ILYODFUR_033794 [Ilyodon furcidens]|uniref:Uncharacterized protein n=1 Tax=Ilyodon furcidens TaxID=33524 RepID=A0ABV0UZ92_9TELE